ncbi:hypothetical protein [Ferruginibacter albus]|uniref:hypothetical protein n=1 Tax=Ferruginibacter albus TaxID=2875540 RepID=UPI001CC769D3|nr:hypothetical protein [Ferruginibacter albus]UAY52706.1 hypothetical protein K9M53_03195 [Ferruginibacter albus]
MNTQYTSEVELILSSLNRDKRDLLDKVAEIDKVIKRIKYGNLNLGLSKGKAIENNITDVEVIEHPKAFPLKADLKVQAIKVFDLLGVASKLSDVRDKYKELTGLTVNLRETLRNLNKHDILKLLQPKGTMRGLYWVKTEWLEDNGTRLKEQHKFDGFDLLYSDEMIEFK